MPPDPIFLTVSQVADLIGVSKATVYRMVHEQPAFPKPQKIGKRASRWRYDEVKKWADKLKAFA